MQRVMSMSVLKQTLCQDSWLNRRTQRRDKGRRQRRVEGHGGFDGLMETLTEKQQRTSKEQRKTWRIYTEELITKMCNR